MQTKSKQGTRADSAPSLTDLADAILDGSDTAWTRFVARAHPLALAICQRRGLRRSAPGGDDLHGDTALRALEIVSATDHAAIHRFRDARARYPQLAFEAWFATIVTHAHIDAVRGLSEAQRRRDGAGGRRVSFVEVEPLDDRAPRRAAMPIERAIELRRILARIASDSFPSDQRQALALWLDGNRADEIANLMNLGSERAATQLLRAARQRLRRLHLGGQ